MKKAAFRVFTLLLVAVLLTFPAFAARTLIPVGQTVGLEVEACGLTVAELDEEFGRNARSAGLRVGDTIVKADGQEIQTAQQLLTVVERCQKELVLTVIRKDKELSLTIEPVVVDGQKRLGIYVREGITGIGTVTYFDPHSGSFGALGHGISNAGGDLVPMERGRALEADVVSIKKGEVGTPGQLQGAFQPEKELGVLERNTTRGVFGKSEGGWAGTPLPIGGSGDVHTGQAVILSDLAGGSVEQYDVEITRIYPNQGAPGRNLLIQVTDEDLLEKTGGIVQGMSGSPIIQDGKFIGAVTHVLVNDPTTGYGILIENMLEAAA